VSNQDKSPPNASDELADLLDFEDEDDKPSQKAPPAAKAAAPRPPVVAPPPPAAAPPPPAAAEADDGLMDALLDEPPVRSEASASSKAVVMPPPSSAAMTIRTTKVGPPPVHPSPVAPPPPPVQESLEAIDEGFEDASEDEEARAAVNPQASSGADEPEAGVSEEDASDFEDADDEEALEAEDDAGDAGGASDAGPPSVLTAPSLRPVPPKAFPHEQDASVRLLEAQQRDAWAARAAWLHAEAQAVEDAAAKARALLTVSELYAMAGEEATARTIATEARNLAPSLALAHRQLRGLLDREGDSKAVLDALDAEMRVLPTPAAKCHSVLLGAEISRLRLSEPEAAKKRFELAARTMPSDPRAHLQRFCEALAATDADPSSPAQLPRMPLPDAKGIAPLGKAFTQVAANRGVPLKGARTPGSLYESLLRARAALSAGDVAGTLANLEALRSDAKLAGGAGWLSASLAASKQETRAKAVDALKSVIAGSQGDLARRALAGLAIEIGDAQAARAATDGAGQTAFEPGDRIALAALSGGTRADVEPWITALLGDSELSPITAAASAALGDPTEEGRRLYPVGSLRAKAAVTLGRLLAAATDRKDRSLSSDRTFDDAVLGYTDVAPESGVARALKLELDVDAGNGGKVGRVISAWPTDDLDRDRDMALAGALIAEVAGEVDRAIADLDRARLTDAKHEGAARARAAHGDAKTASKIIAELAESLGGPRAAILLTEAAMRLIDAGAEAEDIDPLLRKASEAAPKLPFALHLGERAARARGDRDSLIEWLRARRSASEDTLEQALDLVREALLVSDNDATGAASLLEQALRARPSDVGLRELYERLAPEPPADRAAWRGELAAKATGPEAARLALEAALEYERAGDLDRAAAGARQAMEAGEQLLAPIAAFRCAVAGHGAGDLIDALLPRARETEDPVERLEIYERLADLD
jgi:hypothetical protein